MYKLKRRADATAAILYRSRDAVDALSAIVCFATARNSLCRDILRVLNSSIARVSFRNLEIELVVPVAARAATASRFPGSRRNSLGRLVPSLEVLSEELEPFVVPVNKHKLNENLRSNQLEFRHRCVLEINEA